jgi:hypothetical protein
MMTLWLSAMSKVNIQEFQTMDLMLTLDEMNMEERVACFRDLMWDAWQELNKGEVFLTLSISIHSFYPLLLSVLPERALFKFEQCSFTFA